MRRLLLVTILFISPGVYARQQYDKALKKQLDTIMADDQRYRPFMALQPGTLRDSLARSLGINADAVNDHYAALQQQLDSLDLVRVEAIFRTSGYPGKSIVGTPANEVAYYVIQHSGKIKEYFPLIERAGKKGELMFGLVAMMQDRMLRNEYKEQIYGSQYAGFGIMDSVTHEHRIEWLLWPVKDYAHVNERRKKAGFDDTVAENAAAQGIAAYKVLSLVTARKRYPWLFPAKEAR